MNISCGGVKSKEEIINEVLNILNHGTIEEQQGALASAAAERKERSSEREPSERKVAEEDGLVGLGNTEGERGDIEVV